MLTRALSIATLVLVATLASAAPEGFVLDGGDIERAARAEASGPSAWIAGTAAGAAALAAAGAPADAPAQAGPPAPAPPSARPKAFEYSEGYRTRLKIHKYASYAMLPLFVAQYAVGQKLYNGTGSDSTRSAHGVLAASTGVLFGVNTVTGVWNLAEGRKDPSHRTKRMVHGVLMLAADAGFVATGMLAPESEHEFGEGGGHSPSTHRTVALASMGVATVAWLMMLF